MIGGQSSVNVPSETLHVLPCTTDGLTAVTTGPLAASETPGTTSPTANTPAIQSAARTNRAIAAREPIRTCVERRPYELPPSSDRFSVPTDHVPSSTPMCRDGNPAATQPQHR